MKNNRNIKQICDRTSINSTVLNCLPHRLLMGSWYKFEKNSPQNVAKTFRDCAWQETHALRLSMVSFNCIPTHNNVSNSLKSKQNEV